tara:strand:+ start:688 stop:948 length:261 start_codon:yes stop_codon:yes gene_type:complete
MSKYAIDRYKEALETIANASDQANPIQLRTVAQTALDWESTTADEFNIPIITKEEIGKRIDDEIAESVWRDTVLNPDYKSPFNEEE